MAIKMLECDCVCDSGLTVVAAISQIAVMHWHHGDPTQLSIDVTTHKDVAHTSNGTPPIQRRSHLMTTFAPDLQTASQHKQAIDYLKTLPEYAGAVEV
jgi:hypothetical protein